MHYLSTYIQLDKPYWHADALRLFICMDMLCCALPTSLLASCIPKLSIHCKVYEALEETQLHSLLECSLAIVVWKVRFNHFVDKQVFFYMKFWIDKIGPFLTKGISVRFQVHLELYSLWMTAKTTLRSYKCQFTRWRKFGRCQSQVWSRWISMVLRSESRIMNRCGSQQHRCDIVTLAIL